MPPEPNSFTTFMLTLSATSANDSSARAAPAVRPARARRKAPATRSTLISVCLPSPALLGRLGLPGVDGEVGVELVAVAHLDPARELAPLHVLVVEQVDLAGVVLAVSRHLEAH